MDRDILTEAELHRALRRRRPVFPVVAVDQPVSIKDVRAAFRSAMRNRADVGLVNHFLNLILEPRNPFEPQRVRKPKMEAVVFGTLLSLVVASILAFCLAAPKTS